MKDDPDFKKRHEAMERRREQRQAEQFRARGDHKTARLVEQRLKDKETNKSN